MQTFADLGVTGLIELPPAGTLVGLAKRDLPGVETLALKTPDDLEHGTAAWSASTVGPPAMPPGTGPCHADPPGSLSP